MAPKHTIHEDQGSFAATPAIINAGQVVQVGEGYFRAPVLELTADQQEQIAMLKARNSALDSLALESRSVGNVARIDIKINRVIDGLEEKGEGTTSLEGLSKSRAESQEAIRGLKLASKGSFGESIGIKTKTQYKYKINSDGTYAKNARNQLIIEGVEIVALDEAEQRQLDTEYGKFRFGFAGSRNFQRLEAERKRVRAEVKSIRPQGA